MPKGDRIASAKTGMSPKQRDFIEWLCTPRGMRTPTTPQQWGADNQVHPRTLNGWKSDDRFRIAWDARLHELNINPESVSEVLEAMRTQAHNGQASGVAAAKLWLEQAERFRAPAERQVDPSVALRGLSDEELHALAAGAATDELAVRRAAAADEASAAL